MTSPVHQLFDVSVLFATPALAQAAWATRFATETASCSLSFRHLHGFATLVDKAMPVEDLDRRLVGETFEVGTAYVGFQLGLTDQVAVRAMATDRQTGVSDYPDPFAAEGRLRIASRLVADLLGLGGHAVVLHKAAIVVKSAAAFVAELGDLDDPSARPYRAWLDLLAAADGDGVCVRSYGMPLYYGAPNFEVRAPLNDGWSVERAMQAVTYICGRVALDNERPVQAWSVPLWADDRDACLAWSAHPEDDGLLVRLQSSALSTEHPSRVWDRDRAEPGALPFEVYARALADHYARSPGVRGLSLVSSPRFDAARLPPVRVLCFEHPQRAFYATSGFGRVVPPMGDEAAATTHAELCLYAPPGEANAEHFEIALLNVGKLAFTTQAPGGLKDWDGLPPDATGWGSLLVPMDDLPLSADRPIALRLVVPVTADEAAQFRAGLDRAAWYEATITSPAVIAERWGRVAQSMT